MLRALRLKTAVVALGVSTDTTCGVHVALGKPPPITDVFFFMSSVVNAMSAEVKGLPSLQVMFGLILSVHCVKLEL